MLMLIFSEEAYGVVLGHTSHAQFYIDEEVKEGRLRKFPGDSGAHWNLTSSG
jgi:hypothetical protein